MTLDFECDTKDMDPRTADLMETGRTILEELMGWNKTSPDPEIQQWLHDVVITKATNALQIISNCCGHEAIQIIMKVDEQMANHFEQQRKIEERRENIDFLNKQAGFESEDNG